MRTALMLALTCSGLTACLNWEQLEEQALEKSCDDYIACYEATGGTAGSLASAYGPNGTCWSASAETAAACIRGCKSALASLKIAFPQAKCTGGGTGGGGGTTDPCKVNGAGSCSTCTGLQGCGWCSTTSTCMVGGSTGPTSSSCSSWKYVSSTCSGGTGGGGGTSLPNHWITCVNTPTPHAAAQSRCTCTTNDTNTGTTRYSGAACGQPLWTNEFCCKQSGYPASQSCSCYQRSTWQCEDTGLGKQCSCDYFITPPPTPVTRCDNVAGPNGIPWRCCRATYDTCDCLEGRTSCPSGQVTVSDCSTATSAGALPAVNSCPSGTTYAAACSSGL